MDEFFKYFKAKEKDIEWGFYLNVVGRSRVKPNTAIYPLGEHPSAYHFSWENGRILDEYQLIFVTEGNGIFENESGTYEVKPGSFMILTPGTKHRYKPLYRTGWIEYYVGFKGNIANHFMQEIQIGSPVLSIGIREELIDIYLQLFTLAHQARAGFQQIASSLVLKLIAYLQELNQTSNEPTHIDKIIEEARFYINAHLNMNIDMEQLAIANHLSYASFRKHFKQKTGFAPHQYHLKLKIEKAQAMLLTSSKSVKEICYELGFDSVHYFCRLFKKKVGMKASEFRRSHL